MESFQYQLNTSNNKNSAHHKAKTEHVLKQGQVPFSEVMKAKVNTVSPDAVFETMKKHKSKLEKEKEWIETGSEMQEEELTEAQMVKEIKDRIHALALLERRGIDVTGR